jgi:hypothetical protein
MPSLKRNSLKLEGYVPVWQRCNFTDSNAALRLHNIHVLLTHFHICLDTDRAARLFDTLDLKFLTHPKLA